MKRGLICLHRSTGPLGAIEARFASELEVQVHAAGESPTNRGSGVGIPLAAGPCAIGDIGMYDRHQNAYYASEICEFLKKELHGENCVIYEPRSILRPKDHSLVFVDNLFCKDFDYSLLGGFRDVLVITNSRP